MNVQESWTVVENVLADRFPNIYKSLNPGASDADITRLESVIGKTIPDDFRDSLLIHNGQDDQSQLIRFVNYNSLLSVDDMIDDYKMHRGLFAGWDPIEWLAPDKIKNVTWNSGWIKFTESDGDGYVIDLDPGPHGVVGQVFMRYHDDPSNVSNTKSDSFATFLSDCANSLLQGSYEVEDGLIILSDCYA